MTDRTGRGSDKDLGLDGGRSALHPLGRAPPHLSTFIGEQAVHRLLEGNLGSPSRPGGSVADEIAPRIGPTLLLMSDGAGHRAPRRIPFGVISAVRQYGKLDYALTQLHHAASSARRRSCSG